MRCADLLDSWLPVKKGSSGTVNLQLRQEGTQGSSPQGICFDELCGSHWFFYVIIIYAF